MNLYDSIVKNIDGMEILYKKKPIKDSINLIQLFIMNLGSKDLSKLEIEKHPTINFSEDSVIHSASILSKSESLFVNAKLEDQKDIILDTKILKSEEYLLVEALVETQNPIQDSINVDYRIANFEKAELLDHDNLKKHILELKSIAVLVFFVLSIIFGFSYFNDVHLIKKEDVVLEIAPHNKLYEPFYTAFSKLENSVKDISLDSNVSIQFGDSESYTVEELKQIVKYVQDIIDDYSVFELVYFKDKIAKAFNHSTITIINQNSSWIFFGFSIVLSFFFFIWNIYFYYRTKEIRKILHSISKVENKLIVKQKLIVTFLKFLLRKFEKE